MQEWNEFTMIFQEMTEQLKELESVLEESSTKKSILNDDAVQAFIAVFEGQTLYKRMQALRWMITEQRKENRVKDRKIKELEKLLYDSTNEVYLLTKRGLMNR